MNIKFMILLSIIFLSFFYKKEILKKLVLIWLYIFKKYRLLQVFIPNELYLLNQKIVIISQEHSIITTILIRFWIGKKVFLINSDINILNILSLFGIYKNFSIENIPSKTIILINQNNINLVNNIKLQYYLYLCGKSKSIGNKNYSFLTLNIKYKKNDFKWKNFVINSWEKHIQKFPPIIHQWINTQNCWNKKISISDDFENKLSGINFITSVWILRKKLFNLLKNENYIGILLPSTTFTVVIFLTLLSLKKIIIPLNYTSGAENIIHAINQTNINIIISSKRFLKTLSNKLFYNSPLKDKKILYLESLKEDITVFNKIISFFLVLILPKYLIKTTLSSKINPKEKAVILFSSGSENIPKGIILTHENLIANCLQSAQSFNISKNDKILGSLPLFHAFGLTISVLLPLITGMPSIQISDPRNIKLTAKLIKKYQITLICTTPSFLRLYIKNIYINFNHLISVKMIISGGEKLQKHISTEFRKKFHKCIFEGYGTTELSPVISVNRKNTNHTIKYKKFTVGLPLEGCFVKIVDPLTYKDLPKGRHGLLLATGINLMYGYLKNKKLFNNLVQIENLLWHCTGDCASIDNDGYITIHDRYSRFAKIGAEMVSLSFIENAIYKNIDNNTLAEILIISIPDKKKGECLYLIHNKEITENDIKKAIKNSDLPNLFKPKLFYKVCQIPKLGNGKIDLINAKKLINLT